MVSGAMEGTLLLSRRPSLPVPCRDDESNADWKKTSVDLFEYQARDLFESYGVPVLPGIIADTPEEVRAAAEKLGGVTVVKAQVKIGGRG